MFFVHLAMLNALAVSGCIWPILTCFACLQDRRKELSKKVSKMGEDGKVAVRNVRKDILKRLDK
jgi:hypothetical protein